MALKYSSWLPVIAVLVLLYAGQANAFGAGESTSQQNITVQQFSGSMC